MNPSKNLDTLKVRTIKRVTKLRLLAYDAVNDSDEKRRSRAFSYIMIETVNLWSLFVRSLYLSCAQATRLSTGLKVSCNAYGAVTSTNAIDVAMRVLKPRESRRRMRDEPSWHYTSTIVRLATHLNFSNASDIITAASYAPNSIEDIITIRNFYAHRNQEIYSEVISLARSNYGIVGIKHPNQLLQRFAIGRTQQVIFDLLDDLRDIIELMCQ